MGFSTPSLFFNRTNGFKKISLSYSFELYCLFKKIWPHRIQIHNNFCDAVPLKASADFLRNGC